MLPNHEHVAAYYTFGTGAGWHGWMAPVERTKVLALSHLAGPLLTRWKGYLPSSLIGLGEDLPLDFYERWKDWSRFPNYFFGDPSARDVTQSFARIRAPMMAANAIDDRWAPPASRDAFMPGYRNAARHTLDIDPSLVGLRSIGHMGYFKPSATPLWESALDWLATFSPASLEIANDTQHGIARSSRHRRAPAQKRLPERPRCLVAGTGAPVVLLHSSLSSKSQWAALAERLAPRFRVIALDLVRLRRQCDAADAEVVHARRRNPSRRGPRRPARSAARSRARRRPLLRRRGGIAVRAAQQGSRREPDAVRAGGLRHARPRRRDARRDQADRRVRAAPHRRRTAPACGGVVRGFLERGAALMDAFPARLSAVIARNIRKVPLDFQAALSWPSGSGERPLDRGARAAAFRQSQPGGRAADRSAADARAAEALRGPDRRRSHGPGDDTPSRQSLDRSVHRHVRRARCGAGSDSAPPMRSRQPPTRSLGMSFESLRTVLAENHIAEKPKIAATATVSAAVALMKERNVDAVVAMDQDRFAGLFTAHDVLARVIGSSRDASATRIADALPERVAARRHRRDDRADAHADERARVRSRSRDGHGQVLGVLSRSDLNAWTIRNQQQQLDLAIRAVKFMGFSNRRG